MFNLYQIVQNATFDTPPTLLQFANLRPGKSDPLSCLGDYRAPVGYDWHDFGKGEGAVFGSVLGQLKDVIDVLPSMRTFIDELDAYLVSNPYHFYCANSDTLFNLNVAFVLKMQELMVDKVGPYLPFLIPGISKTVISSSRRSGTIFCAKLSRAPLYIVVALLCACVCAYQSFSVCAIRTMLPFIHLLHGEGGI